MKVSSFLPAAALVSSAAYAAQNPAGGSRIRLGMHYEAIAPSKGSLDLLFNRMCMDKPQQTEFCISAAPWSRAPVKGRAEESPADFRFFPDKPGFEDAFAYACLQDPAAYRFADTMLKKVDALIEKVRGEEPGTGHAAANAMARKIKLLNAPPITKGAPITPAAKDALNNEIVELRQKLVTRYTANYGEDPHEVGTSGHDPVRIENVIKTGHPSEAVQLREKMALLHVAIAVNDLALELQRQAGVKVYTYRLPEQKREHLALTDAERNERKQKLAQYIEGAALDFPISIDRLEAFVGWKFASPTVQNFFFRTKETDAPEGRSLNTVHYQKITVPDGRTETRPRGGKERKVCLATWDKQFPARDKYASLRDYVPKFECNESRLLSGAHYFVVNENREWYQENRKKDNLMMMTGPSGTADVFIRFMQLLDMPLEEKIGGIKALIGHMHVDRHHSLHEILLATDGDDELREHLQYDGTLGALKRLSGNAYKQASSMQQSFIREEMTMRNRLESERQAVFSGTFPEA